jgi:hypothetical protein
MNTTKNKIILLLILTLPVLFLTSCYELSDTDWELVETAFESWAEENGLLENDQWQPDAVIVKVVEDKVAEITNQNAAVQLDAVNTVREMEKATQLGDEALAELDTAKMSSAVSLRPDDWTLHEKESAVWSANGNQAAAQAARTKSDDLLRESVANGGDCMQLREQQLRKRRDYFLAASETCKKDPNCSDQEYQWLWAHYDTAQVMVNDIYIYEISPFCGTE